MRFPSHTQASIVSFEFVLVITGLMWGFIPPFRNSCNNIPAHVDDETIKKVAAVVQRCYRITDEPRKMSYFQAIIRYFRH